MVAAANDGLFRRLCERIGLAELPTILGSRTNPDRVGTASSCCRRSARGSQPRRRLTGCERLAGIPVAPAQDLAEVGQRPERANDMLQDVDGLDAVASPLQVDGERLDAPGRRRRCSASTRSGAAELGYGDDDIAALIAREQ